MINGTVYDFESIKIALPTGLSVTAKEITYNAKKDVDVVTDTRGIPRGIVRKKFEGDFSMEMSLYEYELLAASMAATGGVLGSPDFPVVVSYGNFAQIPVTDTLMVKITEVPREAKEDEEITVKISGKLTAIPEFGGNPVYIPTY